MPLREAESPGAAQLKRGCAMKEETKLFNFNYLVLLILSIFTAISFRFCAEQEMSKWVQ